MIGQFIQAQTSQITELEKRLSNLQGAPYVQDALKLADLYYEAGNFTRVREISRSAYREAEKIEGQYAMGLALHWEARSFIDAPGATSSDRKKAGKLLEKSQKLLKGSTDYTLQLANLKLLQFLAKDRGRDREFRKLAGEIAVLESKARGSNDNIVARSREEIPEIKQEGFELKKTQEQQKTLEEKFSKLKQEYDFLGTALESQEKRIDSLSTEQMKKELMLARQRILVDSFQFHILLDSIQMAQQNLTLKEKNSKIKLQKSQRNLFIALAVIGLIIAIALFSRYISIKHYSRILEEKNKIILEEKKRSEELLLNILPAAIADELKASGSAQARQYPMATVLFTDFKDFSKIIGQFSPKELVEELNSCFSAFDKIIVKYGLEKIKTIGDAYMCAGGLPDPDSDHPDRVIRAALDIQRFLGQRQADMQNQDKPSFEARIGIHSGPLIAGVVGLKKFAYDIWGDTVNIAARMESNGEPGKVNISGNTYELIRDEFHCTYRGKIPAKNVGELDMYFVDEK